MKLVFILDPYYRQLFESNLPKDFEGIFIEVKLPIYFAAPDKLLRTLFKSIKRLNTLKQSDAILSVSTLSGFAIALLKKLHFLKIPHIMIDIGLPRVITYKSPRPVLTSLRELLENSIDAVICFSKSQAIYWKKVYGYDRVFSVLYGVNPQKYEPNYEVGDYIISLGRSDRNYDMLIKALPRLNKNVKTIIVYGKDPITRKSPILKPSYTSKNIRVYYELSRSTCLKLIASASFVVLPLKRVYYATGHTVLLESMALGKTVLISKIPAVLEYIENWKTGIFSDPTDEEDFVEKINYLLENEEMLVKIGQNARRAVEEKFNEKNMVNNILRIVQKHI